ncbi:MAG: class I SAM-dependent methyltransferase [Bacteroidota bacterium]|jgi:cyclopropane fatty-acyl-phospholipid synthase-like methyltransferase
MERKLPDDELLYFAGTEELTEKVQARFVHYFLNSPGTVLEIGCGRGVMLEMFKEKGIQAYGIDLSDTTVKYCKGKGLEATCSDLLSHLQSLQDGSIGGIFCAHVIEHLKPEDAIEFFKQAYRVMKQTSKLVIVTPNAKDLRTTERFWMDITHVRPYPEKLLWMLLQREGFHIIQAFSDKEPARNILERIIKKLIYYWFLGYMFVGDQIVIAER